MNDRIPLSIPHLTGNEWRYLKECLDTNTVAAAGSFIERFERAIADFVGVAHGVSASSGTAALHVALRVVGIEAGDEVLVPDFTFVSPVNAVRYLGAWPVLLDVDPMTATIDAGGVERFLRESCTHAAGRVVNRRSGRRVKAILPVHLYGMPADLDRLWALGREFGLAVVEDAAECLGATYKGRRVGAVGDIACLSFNGNKVITTGGGGMILSAREEWLRRARHLITQAKAHPTEYLHDEVGYNYRMPNLNAALGLAQAECLGPYLEKKRSMAEAYERGLKGVKGLSLLREPSYARSSYWLNTLIVDDQAYGCTAGELGESMRAEGIECRRLWPPLHRMAPYRDCEVAASSGAEWLYEHGLNIPSSTGLGESDLGRVVDALRRHGRG